MTIPRGYSDWLTQLKADITQSRQRAVLAVNSELIQLYGRIGHDILQRQQTQGWGAKVIERLANDLNKSSLICAAGLAVISNTCVFFA